MPKIDYRRGDLFAMLPAAGKILIPHVVNSVGAWGAGFVIPLEHAFPLTMAVYRKWYRDRNLYGVPFELGKVLIHQVQGGIGAICVAHMLAQHGLPNSANRKPLDYQALKSCLAAVGAFVADQGMSIHTPLFGAGLAGGDWQRIEAMIDEHWLQQGVSVTCYYLDEMPGARGKQ